MNISQTGQDVRSAERLIKVLNGMRAVAFRVWFQADALGGHWRYIRSMSTHFGIARSVDDLERYLHAVVSVTQPIRSEPNEIRYCYSSGAADSRANREA